MQMTEIFTRHRQRTISETNHIKHARGCAAKCIEPIDTVKATFSLVQGVTHCGLWRKKNDHACIRADPDSAASGERKGVEGK